MRIAGKMLGCSSLGGESENSYNVEHRRLRVVRRSGHMVERRSLDCESGDNELEITLSQRFSGVASHRQMHT